jgi:hypothetical protein
MYSSYAISKLSHIDPTTPLEKETNDKLWMVLQSLQDCFPTDPGEQRGSENAKENLLRWVKSRNVHKFVFFRMNQIFITNSLQF